MRLFNVAELRAALPRGQRLIGLDPGSKLIGVALSDPLLMLASPYATLNRGKLRAAAEEVRAIAAKGGAAGLRVGLPLSMDGSFGHPADSARECAAGSVVRLTLSRDGSFRTAAHSARDWTKALSEAAGRPAALWDERLSSSAVNRMLIVEADLSRAKRARVVDRAAAAWMLQAALDATRPPPAPFPDDADPV